MVSLWVGSRKLKAFKSNSWLSLWNRNKLIWREKRSGKSEEWSRTHKWSSYTAVTSRDKMTLARMYSLTKEWGFWSDRNCAHSDSGVCFHRWNISRWWQVYMTVAHSVKLEFIMILHQKKWLFTTNKWLIISILFLLHWVIFFLTNLQHY